MVRRIGVIPVLKPEGSNVVIVAPGTAFGGHPGGAFLLVGGGMGWAYWFWFWFWAFVVAALIVLLIYWWCLWRSSPGWSTDLVAGNGFSPLPAGRGNAGKSPAYSPLAGSGSARGPASGPGVATSAQTPLAAMSAGRSASRSGGRRRRFGMDTSEDSFDGDRSSWGASPAASVFSQTFASPGGPSTPRTSGASRGNVRTSTPGSQSSAIRSRLGPRSHTQSPFIGSGKKVRPGFLDFYPSTPSR